MNRLTFSQLPGVVQFTSLTSLFMSWVMVEEFIIDRHGLDRFLPLYRYGNLCLYDLAVALLLIVYWRVLRQSQ